MLPIFKRLLDRSAQQAIAITTRAVDGSIQVTSYEELLLRSQSSAKRLLAAIDHKMQDAPMPVVCSSPQLQCLSTGRVPLLDVGTDHYVTALLGTWMAGFASVPLCSSHPPSQWEYFLQDSKCQAAFVHSSFIEPFQPLAKHENLEVLRTDEYEELSENFDISLLEHSLDTHALSVYTSGTTGKPKGVVQSHRVIEERLKVLHTAWRWTSEDRILNFLPLHHVHGLYNVVLNGLYAGATVHMMEKFNASQVWREIINYPNLSIVMAVPTIYSKLIKEYESSDTETQLQMTEACKRLRLMVSGSMALPVPVLKRWEEISGHRLLERYGMTEIGMVLSNPLNGERIAGRVGHPLPGVNLKIDLNNNEEGGELCVKGGGVFCGYWDKPELTNKEFDSDGWFRTGDTVVCDDNGNYKIQGRTSVDILKVAGYKISALDIERVILENPKVKECAVLGIHDEEYGQRIAVIVVSPDKLTLQEIRDWAGKQLPPYQLPSEFLQQEEIEKNAMGKVNKKSLLSLFSK